MKNNPDFPGDALPEDTLSLYLTLEKRIKTLENELSFAKLNINTLYMKIKDLKMVQEAMSVPGADPETYLPGDRVIAYLKANLVPKLNELVDAQEQLMRDMGLGKAE